MRCSPEVHSENMVMTENKRQQDCPPAPDTPADQPPAGKKCDPIPPTTPPTLEEPKPCDFDCDCPKTPGSNPTCIDDLITKYNNDIAAADSAKAFKADLDAILTKAKAADSAYTRDKYNALVKAWVENDDRIADLIRRLVCSLPCWKCLIECYVCQVLDEMRISEVYLWSDTAMPASVHNIYDKQYWYTRDIAAKDRQFQRIKGVLAAWDNPAATIDAANKANKTLIDAISTLVGSENGKAAYDLFIKLVPAHLAIAPPADKWKTKIGKEYTTFCECDVGTPDNCCGPDVGVLSFRQRLIGPQPYLVDPKDFFKLICCLVEQRYAPAKDALAKAKAEASTLDDKIKAHVTSAGRANGGLAWADKAIRPAIPASIVCCDEKLPSDDPSQSSSKQSAM